MANETMNFLGVLSNIDTSIVNLKLEHGFEIKRLRETELKSILEDPYSIKLPNGKHFPNKMSDDLSKINIAYNFEMDWKLETLDNSGINRGNNYYSCIFNSFELKKEEFIKKYCEGYIKPLLSKIRLFSGINVRIPLIYFYHDKGISSIKKPNQISDMYGRVLHLNDEDLIDLNSFLKEIDIPFKDKFLPLALNNFEESFRILDHNLAFLVLMNGMEVLFHPSDREELKHRISRSMAVLIGNGLEDTENKFKEIKDMYDKRSSLVHSGKKDITEGELNTLRDYLRYSIIELYKIMQNKDLLFENRGIGLNDSIIKGYSLKDKILYMLNCTGFKEKRPWIIE